MLKGRRGRRKTKEPIGSRKLLDYTPNEREKIEIEEGPYKNDKTRKYVSQIGRYKNTYDGTKWGYLMADIRLNKIDDRKTLMSNLMSVMASAIGCNELLIKKLVEGKEINYTEIEKDARQVGYGNENGADLTYDKEDVPRLLKEAKENA
jgi:hypothetical protein